MAGPGEPFVSSIGELPLRRRPLYELLGFEDGRDEVNAEYAGYGWCQPARIWLDDGSGAEPMRIDAPLVVAVHAADEPDPDEPGDEVILEFAPPAEADERAGLPVQVRLSRFLERWLPELPGRGPVVLSMCNPRRATVRPPAALRADRPLYYALGDVESWLDEPEDAQAPGVLLGEDERRAGGMVRLVAEAWHRA